MEKQFVAFKVADSFYCIDIMDVQEVVRDNQVTYMPNFPPFVEGVINLRGIIVPIVSIHKRLTGVGIPTAQLLSQLKNDKPSEDQEFTDFFNPTLDSSQEIVKQVSELSRESSTQPKQALVVGETYKLIVIKVGTVTIGLLVDALDKILVAQDTEIQNAEGLGKSISHKMVSGILHMEQEIYIVLNIQGVLENEEEKLLNQSLNQ